MMQPARHPHSFPSWPSFQEKEIEAAVHVLRSGKINQWTGKEVFTFEKEYAGYLGRTYAVAVANGSVALDLALWALDIGDGDEVIVPCRSFVATASCVALRGAVPVFADIDENSQNITEKTILPCITKKTKAIICVHLAGFPCDMDALQRLCTTYGLFLIEDCAQAHGAFFNGRPVGSFGDIACFSFCQDKIISTGGEGGLLATDNKSLWEKVWSFKDHGRDPQMQYAKRENGKFAWTVQSFGSNFRMTEFQAAIGRSMLKRLDAMVKKRRRLAQLLTQQFRAIPALRVTDTPREFYHSYYKYYVYVRPQYLKKHLTRDVIIHTLSQQGIPCGSGVCPEIYRERAFEKYYAKTNKKFSKRLPVASVLGETSLMFLVHPTLSPQHMNFIGKAVRDVIR